MIDPPVTRLRRLFRRLYDTEPQVAVAPGRVNLIGEHTDYNDGFVLPVAIDRWMGAGFRARADRTVRSYADAFDETRTFGLDDLPENPDPTDRTGTWIDYVAGMAWSLGALAGADGSGPSDRIEPAPPDRDGPPPHAASGTPACPGLDLVLSGQVPVGAGLSSSAALEVAVGTAFAETWGLELGPEETARRARRAENDYVGVSCGIMDPYASAGGREGCALLLDCRSLEARHVAIPSEVALLVLDTGVHRSLGSGTYNDRVRECRTAVEALRSAGLDVRSLREVDTEKLDAHAGALPAVPLRRARHVVEENERVHAFAKALSDGRPDAAGDLLAASHRSLDELYEVTSPELDAMAEAARAEPTCWGARMTGAGMGGCVVALVERGTADRVAAAALERYGRRFDHPGDSYRVEPVDGARVVD